MRNYTNQLLNENIGVLSQKHFNSVWNTELGIHSSLQRLGHVFL